MNFSVRKGGNAINSEILDGIARRYESISDAVRREFWGINVEERHSMYVGSYGRGTAISTSDIDILLELPKNEYYHYSFLTGNGQSRLLQTVKKSVLSRYPRTEVHGDGQVVVVVFSDGMRFELLPAFETSSGEYEYPDTHMGGNWKSTNPKAEQEALKRKDVESNGLLVDTCRQIRFLRDTYFTNEHLPGILIDAFVYDSIANWHWGSGNGTSYQSEYSSGHPYEESLLKKFRIATAWGGVPHWRAPGSGMRIDNSASICNSLGKILKKMAEE